MKIRFFRLSSPLRQGNAGQARQAIIAAVVLTVVISGGVAFAMGGPAPQKELTKASTDIRINSLGYLPAAQKKATIISKCSSFNVKEASKGNTVYSGRVTGPFSQQDVNQTVWIADFSKVNKAGKYYLDVPGVGRSYEFEIGDKVYDFAYVTAMRAFYLWRCGTEVNAVYNGKRYYHAACHTDDAWLDYVPDINEPNTKRDGTGGWHDAGDYNKYVVNAGVTVGSLFWAWEQFGDKLRGLDLNLPDTAPGYPDFLKEIKWETDWLLKMQYPDGSGKVSHKISTLTFGGFIMPEQETEKRYFTDYSSAATADFVAMMAMSARYFKPYDPNYAQTCLDAAKKSYGFLTANRENKMANIRAFRTGGYPTTDQDDRMWAAVELWETTGAPEYLRAFERMTMSYEDKIEFYWDWGNVKNLAMFTYLLSKREGKRDTLVEDVRRDLLRTADSIVVTRNKDVYGRCLGDEYRWGSAGTVAREVLTLQIANKVSPNREYVDTALDAINHLFGRNYYGRSFVTGLGYKPPMNPHDRRAGGDRVREPWPGYIIGGGHSATDWQDVQADARTNEIAINWQGALVYALAGFVSDQSQKARFTANWASLKKRDPAPDWFRDAKFGIYFHWGVYSVPAFGNEWYPRNMYDTKSPEYKHHVKTYGEPNKFGYPDFVPMFKAEKFNADEWADLFKKAGAQFAGPVAEHHDGFSMWASKVNPWNAKDMGPKRDCVGELEKAIRKHGMWFVTTFHHERNGLYEIEKNGRKQWTGHYEFVKKNFPELLEDPNRAIMYGYMPVDKYFQMWEDKLVEVIDNYHPDLMYFDSWLDEIPDKYKMEYLAHYFNDAGNLGKEIVVTYKQQDLPREVGVEDFEKSRADKLTDYVWLTDDTISRGSWCYTQDLGIKRPIEIVRTMIDIVSKNGQLMLNISPKADGTIPDNQKKVLLEIGNWLKKYGEAIYWTRPFVEYGEGPAKMETGGGFAKMKGGYTAKDIRYTRKGNTVYAMVLGWPGENQQVTMTMFGKGNKAENIKIKDVTMPGVWGKIKWQRTDAGLVVTTPDKKPSDLAIVFKLLIEQNL